MDHRVRAGEIPEDQTTALMESYSAKLPTSFFWEQPSPRSSALSSSRPTAKTTTPCSSASGLPPSFYSAFTTKW